MKVGFVAHDGRKAALDAEASLREMLEADGVTTLDVRNGGPEVDLVVAIGGDGTFLRAAHVAARLDAPILGVKVGRLGFLTEVEPDEALGLIRAALAGKARIEERMTAVAEAEDGSTFPPQWCLNEIMVEKRARERMVRLRVEVDGDHVTTFPADGVIVATPTGSTAYSFSARGPIVTPQVECLVLSPIAAHMVFDRSIVLAPDQIVMLQITGEEPGVLSADGRQAFELPVGARVRIRASERRSRFVRRDDGEGFLPRVRQKFGLAADPYSGGNSTKDPSGHGSA